MSHTPEELLFVILDTAKEQVEIGKLYYHYKSPNDYYEVLDIVLDEASEEPIIIYKAKYGKELCWARKLNLWLEKIHLDDNITVPRFTKVKSQ
jgi:hypothetical protein